MNQTPEAERKERAREIITRLAALDANKRPGGGVHGQVIGMEPYVIRTSGDGLQCLSDAQSLLDELLDPFDRRAIPQAAAEPVQRPFEEALQTARFVYKGMKQATEALDYLQAVIENPLPEMTPAAPDRAPSIAPAMCDDGGECGAGGYCITCPSVPAPSIDSATERDAGHPIYGDSTPEEISEFKEWLRNKRAIAAMKGEKQ